VAVLVVDAAQIVHVHEADAQRHPLARRPHAFDRDGLVEGAPVAEAGQLVDARQPALDRRARLETGPLAPHPGLVGGEQPAEHEQDERLGGHVLHGVGGRVLVEEGERQGPDHHGQVGQRAPRRVGGAGAEPEHVEVLVGGRAPAGQPVE
jgi:hypothetical protein